MAYVKVKTIRGRRYRYLVESIWRDGKRCQRHLRYLGPAGTAVTEAYRDNIGPVTPILAGELEKMSARVPEEWILGAIRQAVANAAPREDTRKWAYIWTILRNSEREGEFSPSYRELDQAGRRARLPPTPHIGDEKRDDNGVWRKWTNCPECGKERWISRGETRRPGFTGRCRPCALKQGKREMQSYFPKRGDGR
ncbi:hypothetical protein LCGC14_2804360 [marine sediment metagenome]|uniref:Uncharacterized protein n=1 Tax=marine sediment metagenome TaxID=412755 RepID=A0A0F8YLT3_9ZZZZ